MVRKYRTPRGKYGGGLLSAVSIAQMMGCSVWTAKKKLYKLGESPSLAQIGELIYEYKQAKEDARWNRKLGSYFKF
jgi:hypothetical protein